MALRRSLLLTLLIILIPIGCTMRIQRPPTVGPAETAKPPGAALLRLPAEQIPFFSDDMDLASLDAALEKSLDFYSRDNGEHLPRMADAALTVRDMQESISALRDILRLDENDTVKQARIRESFDVYRSTGRDGKNTVLFTGYFEPIINGSLEKNERYQYPIYQTPQDAVVVNLGRFREKYLHDQIIGRVKDRELVPYYSRSEIEELGVLEGRKLELAWVDDRIALFFLHTQGSGKIKLPDGRLLEIGYALKNGRPFRGLARFLLDKGKISARQVSYQSIKRYLREHPAELSEILGYNESFIFFREVSGGPIGSIGVTLTAGRSIATDPALFPRGAVAFIRSRKPILDHEGNVVSWVPFSRFVVNQDAGGAIKGPGRVDLFCGSGDAAENLAGSLSERGELYFLVRKRSDDLSPGGGTQP